MDTQIGAGETGTSETALTASVLGVCFTAAGWARIDENGQPADTPDFTAGRLYPGIQPIEIDGHAMVRIPAYGFRVGPAPEGSPHAGRPCWWISDFPRPGFALHPAFMLDGAKIEAFAVAAFEASVDGEKVASRAGAEVKNYVNLAEAGAFCAARDKFHLLTAYEAAAIQLLQLIEMGHGDSQAAFGRGNVEYEGRKPAGASGLVWRGVHDWWGNHWEWLAGLKIDKGGKIQVWDTEGRQQFVNTGIKLGIRDNSGYPTAMHAETGTGFNLGALFLPSAVTSDQDEAAFPDWTYGYWSGHESVPVRGGGWVGESYAGAFSLDLGDVPAGRLGNLSFRPAFAL